MHRTSTRTRATRRVGKDAPALRLVTASVPFEPGSGPDETGAVTAEYAIATIAAVGFAALLVVILRSDEVRGLLMNLVRHALALPA